VPKSCIYELWEAFNDVAEGFGLTVTEFQEIIRVAIKDYTGGCHHHHHHHEHDNHHHLYYHHHQQQQTQAGSRAVLLMLTAHLKMVVRMMPRHHTQQ
jgi:hypothetical protein